MAAFCPSSVSVESSKGSGHSIYSMLDPRRNLLDRATKRATEEPDFSPWPAGMASDVCKKRGTRNQTWPVASPVLSARGSPPGRRSPASLSGDTSSSVPMPPLSARGDSVARRQKPKGFSAFPGDSIVRSCPGYQGHVPGLRSENIHGLREVLAKEHAVAEQSALSAGLQPNSPWSCTSEGQPTLDKASKPWQVYGSPTDSVRSSTPSTAAGEFEVMSRSWNVGKPVDESKPAGRRLRNLAWSPHL